MLAINSNFLFSKLTRLLIIVIFYCCESKKYCIYRFLSVKYHFIVQENITILKIKLLFHRLLTTKKTAPADLIDIWLQFYLVQPSIFSLSSILPLLMLYFHASNFLFRGRHLLSFLPSPPNITFLGCLSSSIRYTTFGLP